MNKLFTTIVLFALAQAGFSQIVATTNNNGNQLSQILAGNGVTITNVVMNCPNGAAGTFTCNNCNLGMTNGIVLTTGSDTMITGPNNSGSEGWDNVAAGDPSLNSLAGASTKDACSLEFDMNVLSDSVEFRYVFASEEYPEWVNSGYNDAFAFFISGPGIAGQQNIALVPGTNIPVTIDNVNSGSYSQYYNNNGDGYTAPYNNSNYYIQYDGFTKVLTAKRKGLQACQTYHLKLVIADAGDGIYDSGVFLEANSLTSNYVSVDSAETDEPNITNAMEGCVQGKINFRLQTPINQPTVVHYGIGGTATNGVDYTTIADSIIIPAGDSIVTLHINPIVDGLAEGTERVVISLYAACSNLPYDSAVLTIMDPFGVDAGNGMTICAGDHAQLNATGLGLISWNNASTLNNASILNPTASPSVTTTYTVTADVGVCVTTDTVTVTVISAPFTVNAGPDAANCSAINAQLNATVTGNPVNGQAFTYSWTPTSGLSSASIANPVATPLSSTTYVVAVSSGNCTARDTVSVALGNLSISTSSTNETCYGYHNGTANVIASGAGNYTYLWSNNANAQQATGLAGGTYTVTVSDISGCSATGSATVGSTTPIHFSNPTVTAIKCNGGNDGAITINAAGGAGSINLAWNGGVNGNTATGLSAGVAYTVTATDANMCTADTTIVLAEPAAVTVSLQSTNVTCNPGGTGTNITPNAGHDGTANANAAGGTGAYTYIWNTTTADVTPAIAGLTAGSYAVTVADANNCTASGTTTITEPQPMSVTASSMAPLCYNSANGTINANCEGGNGSFMYSLSFNNSVVQSNNMGAFASLVAGDYVISVSDARGCTKVANINLPQPNADEFQIVTTPVSCYGFTNGTIVVTPVSILNQPYLYSVDNGGNQQLNEFYNLAAGAHNLHIVNNNGCATDTTVMIASPAAAELSIIPGDTAIELGSSIQLNTSLSAFAMSDSVQYSWSPNAGLSCTDCANPTVNSFEENNEYKLTVTYNGVCKVEATAKVTVAGNPAPFIPNAFSPNGDGNNDVFMVFGKNLVSVDMKIFNRWGELVFSSDNQFNGWDGTYKGELQNTNVFVYQVSATFLDGRTFDSKGTVTLIR